MIAVGDLAVCGAPPNGCGFRGRNWRAGSKIAAIDSDGSPVCHCGSRMVPLLAPDGGERLRAYRGATERAGTVLIPPGSNGVALRIGGAITKHPLARTAAHTLAVDLRKLGAEVRTTKSGESGDDRVYLYLSGCSFVKGERL